MKAWLLPSLTMALLSMAFVGCENKEGGDAPSITVAEEQVVLEATKNAKATVNVTANCEWVATSDQTSWLTINPRMGNGTKQITLTAKENSETASRTANLTITDATGKVSTSVAVVQMGTAATVELQGDIKDGKLAIANEVGAQQGFTVTSNVKWEGAQDGNWFKVETSESNSRTAVTVTVTEANETLEVRTGTYSINFKDGNEDKSVVVTLEQAACVPALSASVEAVTFATTDKGEMTFTLTAAGPWTLTAPEWATVTPTEGKTGETTIAVSVAANDAPAKKQGEIVVKSSLKNDVVLTLPATQAGNEPEITAEDVVEASCAAGVVEFTFSANYGWTALANDSWIALDKSSGAAGNNTLKLTIGANTPDEESKGAEREGTIDIICTHPQDNSLTVKKTVTIKQAEFDGYDLSEVETANCYITTKTNCVYKFNAAVRGNGKSDQEMYIDVQPIDLEVDGMQAIELWRDNQTELISGIELNAETGYITFKVNEGVPNGNVVIALAELDEFDYTIVNKVYWSWHIWVNNEDIEAKAMPITYPEFTSGPTVAVTMMDRNLGALINGRGASLGEVTYGNGGVQDSYGMHYEWGRKDPFPGCNEAFSPYRDSEYTTYLGSTRYQLWRTVDGVATDVTSIFNGTSIEGVYNEAINNGETPDETTTINYAVANPTIYITGGGQGSVYADVTGVDDQGAEFTGARNLPSTWLFVPENLRNASGYYSDWSWPTYLWGNSNNGFTTYGQKTIYDPCPPGWRVPDAAAFNFIAPFWSSSPLRKDENGQIFKHLNVTGETTWSKANEGDNPLGASYVYEPIFEGRDNQAYNTEFKAGYEVYTGGYQTGETMFLPMSGQLSYDSGRPESDYSGWGSSASYATNAQNGYKQYISRLEIYAPSGNITESWNYDNETKVHSFPGAGGSPGSSFHQAAGYSVRCMKDVAPEIEEGI
ncbi:MAG: BACON domain-containing protein [Rikenellaceae bacterium]|nr:BACON domain-containing protein [Rikenellaceae bacterium]